MEVDIGHIVISIAGRDKNRLFYVMKTETDFVYLADGRLRKTEAMKKKKRRHVAFVSDFESRVSWKIKNGEKVLNSEIRRALSDFAQDADGEAAASSIGR